MSFFEPKNRNYTCGLKVEKGIQLSHGIGSFLRIIICWGIFGSVSLWGSRAIFLTLEGDFEQVYRVVEQGGVWRIDALNKNWSILYHSQLGRYTGLEHRDATYWSFRWEEVQRSIQGSSHHLHRLGDLNIEGFASYDLTRPADEKRSSETWMAQEEKGDQQWQGRSSHFWRMALLERSMVEVQSVAAPIFVDFLARFLVIHEQIRQAVVRPLWPEWLDGAALVILKKGEGPYQMNWGTKRSPLYWKVDRFEEKTDEPNSFFEVSKKYRPTTPEALRGILDFNEER